MMDDLVVQLVQMLIDAARDKGYAQGRGDALRDLPVHAFADSAMQAVLHQLIEECGGARRVRVDTKFHTDQTIHYGVKDLGIDPTNGIYHIYEIVQQ
jgi:hypothetical protein